MNAEIDISEVELRSERLLLRPFSYLDLQDFYEYARVDGVGQMAGWIPHESVAVTETVLKSFVEGKRTFALVYEGKVIGSLGIERYSEEEFPELDKAKGRMIGYVLSKDYWGRGLMPEAVNRVIAYLFEEVGLDFILCGCFLHNRQSKRVIEKCGFRHYAYHDFKTHFDTVEKSEMHILYKEEWKGRK